MKKFYSFILLFLACILSVPAYAGDVVTEIGEPIRSMDQLKVGDKILLYCNGPLDPSHKEYGTRNAFLCERDNYKLVISRDLRVNTRNSCDYLWTITSYDKIDAVSYKISFKSPRNNNLPTFKDNPETVANRWLGMTVDPNEEESGFFTLTFADEANDSIYYIMDKNGIFFNGQNLPKGATKGSANFVGWNKPGDNSQYMIYKPTVEEKESYVITMVMQDTEGNEKEDNSNVVVEALLGDSIQAPAWKFHTFLSAVDMDTEEPVAFPYHVDGSEPWLILTYEKWPHVTLACLDEANPQDTLFSKVIDAKKGSKLKLPTKSEVGLGYSLVTEGYEDYELTQDEDITLIYRQDGNGVPFETTTVKDEQFAADTKWYVMNVRGNKVLAYDEATMGIVCAPVEEFTDANLWAFTGDLKSGYKIYNKVAGASLIMSSADAENSTQLFMTPEVDAASTCTFELDYNNNANGYVWKSFGSYDSYLNDFAGTGVLKYWKNKNAKGDEGSRFSFMEYTEAIGDAFKFGDFITYLNAENCVGGWTADQLSELKAAYAAKDVAACQVAVENLAGVDTIAFDVKKAYALVSAYKGFVLNQPGKTYAMAVEAADTSVVWKDLNEADKAFHFGFRTATDSTSYIVAVEKNLPIGSFRFGGAAKCVEWGGLANEEGVFEEGVAAPFSILKSACAPASYQFVHKYNPAVITLSANPVTDAKATSGLVGTYNKKEPAYNNYWRLKVLGEWDGIEDTVVVAPGQQNNVIYDLSGRRVQKAVKGLYIINGKKVYVK